MVTKKENRTAIETAIQRLRARILDHEVGAFLGGEEALVAQLECSRATVRQAARLLEREGLLQVRRGLNGGYFGARPDAGTIEQTVADHLETIGMDNQDITIIATALWVEAVRKAAARSDGSEIQELAQLRRKVLAVKADASFEKVRALELESQDTIFALAGSAYIKLIFDINVVFSQRKFEPPLPDDSSEDHLAFVAKWRDAKLLEINTIVSGDRELASLSARYSRKVWHRRISQRFALTYAANS